MAYSLTTAANVRALVDAIQTFAVAQGWTAAYSVLDATNGKQLGLSNGKGAFIAIGERSNTRNPFVVTGGTDADLNMAIATGFTAPLDKYWGHAGSLCTAPTSNDRVVVNDLLGPFSEVHFFGTIDYVHVLLKSTANRWTHFSFGMIDSQGASAIPCPYIAGTYFEWWDLSTLSGIPYRAGLSRQQSYAHSGAISGNSQFQFIVPNGVLDPSLGFAAGAQVCNGGKRRTPIRINGQVTPQLTDTGVVPSQMDMATVLKPLPTTGGTPMWPIPIVYVPAQSPVSISCWLGELPGIRACNILELAPGAEVTYATETWKTAPWKRKGTVADVALNIDANTLDYGIAFRK